MPWGLAGGAEELNRTPSRSLLYPVILLILLQASSCSPIASASFLSSHQGLRFPLPTILKLDFFVIIMFLLLAQTAGTEILRFCFIKRNLLLFSHNFSHNKQKAGMGIKTQNESQFKHTKKYYLLDSCNKNSNHKHTLSLESWLISRDKRNFVRCPCSSGNCSL